VPAIAADTLLLGGRIHTLDARRPSARALAVAGGRIVAVGGPADVKPWRGRRTRVIDLRGATVTPGLVDAHAHMDREGLKLIYPSRAGCRSIGDIQRIVGRRAAATPRGEWIVTMPVGRPPFYLDPRAGLAEKRWPTREDLDAAAPDHPVYIRGIWGYWNRPPVYSIASTAALRACGITRDTLAPAGVEILKDAAGEPTGVFVEHISSRCSSSPCCARRPGSPMPSGSARWPRPSGAMPPAA
jgi:predicted amidohydrolase YtcJ